jgi:non-homologous end joining protein Ku
MKELAHVIIERKAGHFRPEEFNDRYEDAVVELMRAKQAGMPAKVVVTIHVNVRNCIVGYQWVAGNSEFENIHLN